MAGPSAATTPSCSPELGLTRRPCRGLLPAAFQNVAGFQEISCRKAFSEGLRELSPASSGDRKYLQYRLHRLLRFHAEHGHRAAAAPLKTRRSNPGISTSTELTKGRIDLLETLPGTPCWRSRRLRNVGGLVGAKLASAAWPHCMSLSVLRGADRCGQSCASSIDCLISAPDRRILMMSASAMGP